MGMEQGYVCRCCGSSLAFINVLSYMGCEILHTPFYALLDSWREWIQQMTLLVNQGFIKEYSTDTIYMKHSSYQIKTKDAMLLIFIATM
ncbi:hypothetical protein Zm00014a_018236 [Zea mays]|uniref:Uncharacterized protein n=1 Tax=Zea mays TaxID=4577 RepID=A0A3L6EVV3_MAIZE|nr:hypothetical protein Zm00014a_018236 [Zea mays]